MALELLLLRQAIVLAGTGLAGYTDARTGLILDKITYPMIALGILLNLWEQQWFFLAVGALVFAIGYIVYYMGKIGGGDVKLFTGMAFLLPVLQEQIFLLNALFAACILAVTFYSAYYLSKYARKGIDWKENRQGIGRAIIFGGIIIAWVVIVFFTNVISMQAIIVLSIPLMLAIAFLALERGIRRCFFLKKVSLKELDEDEVIATEFLDEKVGKALNLKVKGVFGEKEKEKLKQVGVNIVPVYRGMPPFGPFIFLGCVVAILQPDILSLLFA